MPGRYANKNKKKKASQSEQKIQRIARSEAKKVLSSELELMTFQHNNVQSPGVYEPIAPTNATVVEQLFEVAQGDVVSTRNGNVISPKSISFNYAWTVAAPTASVDEEFNRCRLIIFQWHDDNEDNAPTILDLLEIPNDEYGVLSPYNVKTDLNRFTILHDEITVVNQFYNNNRSSSDVKKIYVDKKLRKIKYNGSSSINGTNQIYILALSDSTAGSMPELRYATHLRYTDA